MSAPQTICGRSASSRADDGFAVIGDTAALVGAHAIRINHQFEPGGIGLKARHVTAWGGARRAQPQVNGTQQSPSAL